MKKIRYILITALLFTGCADKNKASSASVEEDAIPESTIVLVARDIPVDDVESFLLESDYETDYLAMNSTEQDSNPCGSGYETNAIITIKDGVYGFNDYDGNTLLTPQFTGISLYAINEAKMIYGYWGTPYDSIIHVISKDYLGYTQTDNTLEDTVVDKLYVSDDKIYFKTEEGQLEEQPEGHNRTALDSLYALTKNTVLVPDEDTGTALLNNSGIVSQMKGYACSSTTLANGYTFLSNTPYDDPYNTEEEYGKFALFNTSTGEQLTDFVYDDHGYMWNGLAPVEKDGKWGFVDESGNQVIECFFEDVSSLHDDKAYVKYNGEWNIINITESLAAGEITEETYRNKIANYDAELESTSIGKVVVNVSDLNIRSQAGTAGSLVGNADEGKTYYVFEVTKDDSYTWYRIGEDQWIADDGTWVTYTEK